MSNLVAANLSLPAREAIPDALYRSIAGLDTADKDMFASAWHKNATFAFDDFPPTEGLDAILESTFQYIGAGLDTTHCVGNVRIALGEDGKTAAMNAHAIAQHYRKGEGRQPQATRYLTGSIYSIDLAVDESDGLWKMLKFHMKVIWAEGDSSILGVEV